MAKFRFAAVDHEQYGETWFEVNVFTPGDIDAGILERWEEATGYLIFGDYTDRLVQRSVKALRAMCWLAYLISGGDIDWDDFHPQVHLIEWRKDPSDEDGDGGGEAPGPNRATRRAATKTRSKAAQSRSSSTTTT